MGDAAADVESEIENVLEMFCPDIFNYFFSFEDCKVKPWFNKPLHPLYNM